MLSHIAAARAAGETLQQTTADKLIKVQYYAILREQAGRSEEAIVTAAQTPHELYAQLKPFNERCA